jgi:4-amino-4-deoxy-L-arabinose transferase-like glycosyltransferase
MTAAPYPATKGARRGSVTSAAVSAARDRHLSGRQFWFALGAVVMLAVAIRVGYLVGWKRDAEPCTIFPPKELCGDAVVYHEGAKLLVDGKGFIRPIEYEVNGQVIHSADHPPLFMLYLSAFTLVGLGSVIDHQLAGVLLGAITVVLVGVIGRRIGSPRVGLIAAFFTATYALIWVNDLLVMSESLAMATTAGMVLAAYTYYSPAFSAATCPQCAHVAAEKRGGRMAAVALGVLGGLTALTRAELAIDLPLIAVALVWWAVPDWRSRLTTLGTIFLAAAVVVAPWVARNLYQFEKPVLLSNSFGLALAYSNCDRVYYGERLGYWEYTCGQPPPPAADVSIEDELYRQQAFAYISNHERRVPVVVVARVLRQWSFFHPNQQTALDVYEGRDRWVSRLGLAQYYGLLPLGAIGFVAMRRRGLLTWPLTALFVGVTITAIVTYGVTRFRVPAEIGLVILAAFGVDAIGRALLPRRAVQVEGQSPGGST